MLRNVFRHWAVLAMALVLNSGVVWAQSDPPARVGRLSFLEDGVVFRADRNDPGAAAVLNWPVTSGNILDTRRPGRAEVWIGSTGYRLADDSQIDFLALDDQQVAVRVNRGTLTISILDRDQVDDIEVVVAGARVRFQTPGRYRFDVWPDFSALTVQAGHASFDNGRQVMPVVAGQRYALWRDGREGLEAMSPEDNFDRWVAARENASLAGVARRYVSPRMSGYQDLDAWGEWQTVPEYGAVWYPQGVGSDWAPYRFGRWAWVAPWGWTWIDAAPWGFAPFHYGRWVLLGGRWAWVPGQHVARPIYAPALVGWAGRPDYGPGFRPGRMPAAGWFPLGPREVYVPAYRHSPDYVQQMNRAHVRDRAVIEHALRRPDERRFMYRQQPGAVTSVPLEPRREFRAPPGREPQREMNREPTRDFGRREPGRDFNHDFQREPDRDFRREPQRDLRPMVPGEIRPEPRQHMERPPEPQVQTLPQTQPAPTLRVMPPSPQAPATSPIAPPMAPLTPPPAPRQTLPSPPTPPAGAPMPPTAIQPMTRQPMEPSPAPAMPERQREFREQRVIPQPAVVPSAPQGVSPPPAQAQGGHEGGRNFREGPRQERPSGERRGEGRDHDEGRGPR